MNVRPRPHAAPAPLSPERPATGPPGGGPAAGLPASRPARRPAFLSPRRRRPADHGHRHTYRPVGSRGGSAGEEPCPGPYAHRSCSPACRPWRGVARFAVPRPFDAVVPRALPGGSRALTYTGGAVEPALAAGLAAARTRKAAAPAAPAFFVGVFPANVKKRAVDRRRRPAAQRAVAHGRLPLHVPLALGARGVAAGVAEDG